MNQSAQCKLKLAFCALPIVYLWAVLIKQLSISWIISPQYAYGWTVPFLCLYLVWNRLRHPTSSLQPPASRTQLAAFAFCALLYAPVRLVQDANPGWSLVTWPLALLVIALTLLTIRLALCALPSAHHTSHLIFPFCFFLVAVPWPFVLESPVIQGLTRFNTSLTVEILGWLGIPAMPQGNVIELATGSVGIDEACSGIRSLQATLMLSLFFGELYRLSVRRRFALCLAGFALALVCNLGRTLLLTWVASRQGIGAIAGWHDPAGVTILVACFLGLWGIGAAMRLTPSAQGRGPESAGSPPNAAASRQSANLHSNVAASRQSADLSPSLNFDVQSSMLNVRAFHLALSALALWLLLVEAGVAAWYHRVEAGLPAQPTWTITWPEAAANFQEVPIAEAATRMLRYDEARQAQWREAGGTRWQLSWFRWKPGQAAGYLARTHNPLICMPAAGYEVISVSPVEFADVQGLQMPLRIYRFRQDRNSVFVLYTRWEDKALDQSFASDGVTRLNRLQSIWRGRGNHGERVLSLALWGTGEAEGAREQLLSQLRRVLSVSPPLRQRL